MSTERLIVDQRIADIFIEKLTEKIATLRAGDPAAVESVLGALIDVSAGLRIKALVDDALSKGARLVIGAQVEGCVMQPTLLDGVTESMRLYQDERSEEHTSELQSLMRISYAVFCLKKQQKMSQNTE